MRPPLERRTRIAVPARQIAGQAAAEVILILSLVIMALVLMPDNVIERLMVAIEGRYQAILNHAGKP
ncbi:MAG: hypothetical protein EBT33_13200 [Betaproteobacteria bacterium]|nr:hypothetical protein [Betaproteobacteria bacterium]